MKRFLFAGILGLLISGLPAADFALVRDGRVAACLVVHPDDATAADFYAAVELADYVEKVSGARLPVSMQAQPGVYPVYLGNRFSEQMPKTAAARLAQVKNDGFLLAALPEGLFVWSRPQEPAGVIFGACEILKKYAGVRWFYPGDDGEYVPSAKTVAVPGQITVVNPGMIHRRFNTVCANVGTTQITERWMLRNKMTARSSRFTLQRSGGGHIFSTLLPDTLFFTHPEYYGLYEGKRLPQVGDPALITGKGTGGQHNQPCTSNPDTVRIMQENLLKLIAARQLNYFTILNNDSTRWCQCENCRKLDPPQEVQNGSVSTRFWRLANALIEAGRKEFPEVVFNCSAYQNFMQPPVGVKPDPGAEIDFCLHHRCYVHSIGDPACGINARPREILEGWSRRHGLKVKTYEYTSCLPHFEVHYLPLEKLVAEDLKYYASLGNTGYCDEVPPIGAVFGPHWQNRLTLEMWKCNFMTHYMQASFMWDAAADFEAVFEDLGRNYFAAAWPVMKKYREALRAAYSQVDGHFIYGTAPIALGMVCEKEETLAGLQKLLAEGQAAAGDNPLLRKRVEDEREYFQLTFARAAELYRAEQREPCFAKKCKGGILLDGVLDEDAWRQAVPVSEFFANLKGGSPMQVQTFARVIYDEEFLYLGIEGLEPETGQLKALSTVRDGEVYEDNCFELFFAPPSFGTRYIHWVVNHRGNVYDSLSNTPIDRDISFNLKAEHAVKVNSDRWVLEIKIPFQELGGAPADGARWPVNVARGRQTLDKKDSQGGSWSSNGIFHGRESYRKVLFQ